MILASISFATDFSKTSKENFSILPSIETETFGLNFYPDNFNFNNELQNCTAYLNKGGYCTDWVFQRIGKRQSGNANQWSGNLKIDEGDKGDVGVQLIGKFGHVFVIEGRSYKPYTSVLNGYVISEFNFGAKWINQSCGVTNLFGVRTQRIIPLNQVARIWRP